MVNKNIKKVYKIICVLIICLIVFSIRENNEIKEFGVQNESVNKSVNLKSMAVLVKDFANQEQEKIRQEQEKLRQEEEKRRAEEAKRRAEEEKKALEQQKPNVGAVKTLSGKLTAYVANCPGCSGRLGCNGQNVSNGTTTYQDSTFGVVNIVASSSNLPCGSIVRFNHGFSSTGVVTAIVLDRGVSGTTLDILVDSVQTARTKVGSSTINYDVLRVGY